MAASEFAALQTLFGDIYGAPNINLTAANEHETFIERKIRVIKERTRALRHTLPFKTLPRKMVANMVLYVTKLLNFFPVKNGLSDTLSPKAIMSSEQINYKHYKLPIVIIVNSTRIQLLATVWLHALREQFHLDRVEICRVQFDFSTSRLVMLSYGIRIPKCLCQMKSSNELTILAGINPS
jgi:hypothetical protein